MRRLFLLAMSALVTTSASWAQAPYSPPRTLGGHVDFQGVWTQRWISPLERPPESAGLIVEPGDSAELKTLLIDRLRAGDPIQALEDLDPLELLRIDGQARSSLIVDPNDGKLPYTAEGAARRAAWLPNRLRPADNPEERGTNERCLGLSSAFAPHLTAPVANIRQIIQTPDHVVIYTEHYMITRIIPLGAPRPAPGDRHGQAAARWEGDTLVVESTGFRSDDTVRFVPLSVMMISPATRVTERFTRISDEEILYRFTVTDPALYTQPWSAESVMTRSTERMYEYACHEGNHGLANILSGGRATDRN